tara:strand:- start:46574 stop:46696 length:123 start_codon:yes stop_codon:yes gene_type:complete
MVPGILCRKREAFLGKPLAAFAADSTVFQDQDHGNLRFQE